MNGVVIVIQFRVSIIETPIVSIQPGNAGQRLTLPTGGRFAPP